MARDGRRIRRADRQLLAEMAVAQAALGDRKAARSIPRRGLEAGHQRRPGAVSRQGPGGGGDGLRRCRTGRRRRGRDRARSRNWPPASTTFGPRPRPSRRPRRCGQRPATRRRPTELLDKAAEAAKAINDFPANRAYALVAVAKAVNGPSATLQEPSNCSSRRREVGLQRCGDPQQQKDALRARFASCRPS